MNTGQQYGPTICNILLKISTNFSNDTCIRVWMNTGVDQQHHVSLYELQYGHLYIARMNITTCQQYFVHLHELYNGNCT